MSMEMQNMGADLTMQQAFDSYRNKPANISTDGIKSVEQAKQAGTDFEAFFLSQMMEHMFAGIETEGMFGGGNAEKVYRSMMIDNYGKMVAKKGGIGIADKVTGYILETQAAETRKQARASAAAGAAAYAKAGEQQ